MNHKKLYGSLMLATALATLGSNTQARTIELGDGWTLQGRYKATVPSTVMGVLTANGEYAGILDGTAYKNIDRSRFDRPWTYSTKFHLRHRP